MTKHEQSITVLPKSTIGLDLRELGASAEWKRAELMTDPLEEIRAKANAETCVLRLSVTGQIPRFARAIANVRRLCDRFLKDRYELSIIALVDQPEEAQEEQVIAAPMLLKMLLPPLRRLIGTCPMHAVCGSPSTSNLRINHDHR